MPSQAALQSRLDAGEVTLTLPAGRIAGSWAVRRDVVLLGAGTGSTRLEALPGQPLLRIEGAHRVEIADLTLAGGESPLGRGGGVSIRSGRLRLVRCALVGHRAVLGGAVYAGGTAAVEIEESRIAANHATKGGGGVAVTDTARLTLRRVTFDGNTAEDAGHHLYVMGRPGSAPDVWAENVVWTPCAGRGTGLANVRGFEGRFTLVGSDWPTDSLKVPRRPANPSGFKAANRGRLRQ